MTSEIFIQKARISSTSKTGDMSDNPRLAIIADHCYRPAIPEISKIM